MNTLMTASPRRKIARGVRGKGPHPLSKTELRKIVDRHNGALTEAFHHDILLAQGFPGHQPWANEAFHDPVVTTYLNARYTSGVAHNS